MIPDPPAGWRLRPAGDVTDGGDPRSNTGQVPEKRTAGTARDHRGPRRVSSGTVSRIFAWITARELIQCAGSEIRSRGSTSHAPVRPVVLWAKSCSPAHDEPVPNEGISEMFRFSSTMLVLAVTAAASAQTATGSYSNDFSSETGFFAGQANRIGAYSTLQLVGDYGQQHGTWTTGSLSMPNATGPITSFNASFKFAFNNNAEGAYTSDGFSFLFGDMTDLSGAGDWGHGFQQDWKGGEWGLNYFSRLQSGLSVNFRTLDQNEDLTARWGRGYSGNGFTADESATNITGSWLDPVIYGHSLGSTNGNGDGNTGLGSWYAANNGPTMATAYIDWTLGGDLVVRVALPGQGPVEHLRTSDFSAIDVGENFSFGLAGRIGGNTWDLQIDDFNVSYSYEVPGPAAIAGLAGLGLARRRRQR